MTKDAYFEMCEQLGTEPIESEIPIEFDDLLLEVQEALRIYNYLQDSWDYMNGNYIGKNFNGFMDVLRIMQIPEEDHRSIYEIVVTIDGIRHKILNTKKQQQKARN